MHLLLAPLYIWNSCLSRVNHDKFIIKAAGTAQEAMQLGENGSDLLTLLTEQDFTVNVNNSSNVKSIPSHSKSGRGEVAW